MERESEGRSNYRPITDDDVNAAQMAWCGGLVRIGKVYSEGGDYKALANLLIDDLYDYNDGTVFFKPTLAFGANAFRSTKEGALSYFIAGNPEFPEDTGFALKRWVNVRYDNNAAENGSQITVEKTLVFRRCSDGKLRLCAHKSALPYDPAK